MAYGRKNVLRMTEREINRMVRAAKKPFKPILPGLNAVRKRLTKALKLHHR